MSDKQAHLNGAYYGPSIPPTKQYHRPGRGAGCGCGCCLLSLLFKLIITVVFIVGLAALIIWLIFRPINPIKFHVTDVSLTEFNLTSNNNLQYKLAVNITIRNPNKKIGVYYDRIEARVYYEGQRLDSNELTPFYQGHKNTSVLSTVFEGQQLLLGEDLQDFNKEKPTGIYSIDVKLYLKIRFKLSKFVKTPKFKPKIKCDLKVPMSNSNDTAPAGYKATKCDLDF
ncbi:hypothetical protein Pint_36145 [Pistacia integerrima]|uniref:Uncharacterized protein n=1 Tax=Pistacia integerrima TaxID=434235 RepID=A0ACC0Y1N5_9ROSI|nr:hypothetical protein Pint_36145 [Pistacia integerrima]